MKRYKIHWRITNLFTGTQAEVVKVQNYAKGLFGSSCFITWQSTSASHAFAVAAVGFIVDIVISCIYLQEITEANEEKKV